MWSENSFLVWGILNRFLGDWAMPMVTRAKVDIPEDTLSVIVPKTTAHL